MENLGFGLAITATGMGIVFGLLILLLLVLTLTARLDRRSAAAADAAAATPLSDGPAPAETPVGAEPGAPTVRVTGDALEPDLAAAITVAVLRHVETRRRQAAPALRTALPGSQLFASRWVAAGRMRQGQSFTRRGR